MSHKTVIAKPRECRQIKFIKTKSSNALKSYLAILAYLRPLYHAFAVLHVNQREVAVIFAPVFNHTSTISRRTVIPLYLHQCIIFIRMAILPLLPSLFKMYLHKFIIVRAKMYHSLMHAFMVLHTISGCTMYTVGNVRTVIFAQIYGYICTNILLWFKVKNTQ